VVVSVPHIGHNVVIACLIEENFDYQDWGLLDKTHIRFFGIHNIQRLFNDAGFKIVDAKFIIRPPERTEFADRWRRVSGQLKQTLAHNRFGNVYQVVIKAKLDSAPEKGLKLWSLPVPDLELGLPLPVDAGLGRRAVHLLRAKLLPYVSLRTRTRLGNLLNRIGFRL
jgi:hypothetical protein